MTTSTQSPTTDEDTGVQMDFISRSRSKSMSTTEKINMVLDRVSDGVVVVLEEGFTPDEKSKLVEWTMNRTDGENFTGIEIETFKRQPTDSGGFLNRFFSRDTPSELTLVGPANRVHTLDKDESFLRTIVQQTV